MPLIKRLKRGISAWRKDEHMREVMRGTRLAFLLKVVGAGLNFAFTVAIGRMLGAEGTGIFFLAMSVTAIGSVVGRVGLDNSLLRFTATHATKGEWDKVKGVHRLGLRIAITASGTLSLLGFALGPWMAGALFNKPELGEPLRWMSLAILPFALLNLQAESLKGLKRIRDAMLIQGIGVPFVALALIWPLASMAGVEGASWAYTGSTLVVALTGWLAWRRAMAGHEVSAQYPFADLWASCKPLLITSIMNRAVLPWTPIFLLGIWASSDQVGIFATASRVAMLVSFMLVTVNSVVAPKFAELHAKGEMQALGATARRSALLVTTLASPIFVVLIFGGGWIMAAFGPGFDQGASVLAILAIGQLVNALTGSVNHFLIVTGNEIIVRNTVLLAALAQVGICVIAIPYLGALGAAMASAAAMAGLNLVAAYMVWKRLGVVTIPLLWRRS